jgi:drug/metabolite transporter (DMT)-like permease
MVDGWWRMADSGQRMVDLTMTTAKQNRVGLLMALSSVVYMSAAPILIKVGLAAEVDPVTLLTLRMTVATAIFWGVFLLFWPDRLHIDRRGLVGCAAVAAANTTSLYCYYWALTRIDASVAHMIFAFYPAVALLLLALRGERLTRRSLVRVGLGIFGVYLLIGPGGQVDPVGALLVMGTASSYALHMTLGQWYLREVRSQTVALYVVSLMALMMTVIRLLQFEPWQSPSLVGWGAILAAALVSTVLARLAMFGGIQRIGSGQTALFGPIETLLTVLWAILFLGERLSPVQWSGGLLILVSAMLVVRRRAQLNSVLR